MKLGTLLLRNAAIGLSQLEAALRNQVLYGGRLGTNLVELGFIDLELLSSYLAELSGYPIATPTLLEEIDKSLVDKLGSDTAHRLRAIPLGYVGEHKDTVAVAVVEPTHADILEELSQKFGKPITPYVVPELRALYYLEKHFGLPRRARFIRTGRADTQEPQSPEQERRKQQPPAGIVMPPPFTLEPRRRRSSSQISPISAERSSSTALTLSYGATCEKIDTAEHRDQIADALCEYAKGRLDALLVFLIRDGNALGWRGYLSQPELQKTPIEELSLPLGGASTLQSAHDAGETFVGGPQSAAKPVETALWTAIGANPEPVEVAVIPVVVKQRAVNLIYAHVIGGPPPAQLVTELSDLAARCATTYLRLIRQSRGS